MNVTLRPEHEKLIAEAMQTGAYEDAGDVIGQALETLQSENEWLREHKDAINAKIERAFRQFEQGEFFTAEESRADLQKRKLAWLNERKRG